MVYAASAGIIWGCIYRSLDLYCMSRQFVFSRLFFTLVVCSPVSVAEQAASRLFSFEYQVSAELPKSGSGPVHVFIPLATQTEQQVVLTEVINASIPGQVEVEPVYGNRYWHGSLPDGDGQLLEVSIETTVERRGARMVVDAPVPALSANERERLALFLGSNSRVLVDHPILQPILKEVRDQAQNEDSSVMARTIYDWVVDNVEYKKVGTGWGNGDTYWACNERYGNCTDFHALLISLGRTVNIPARFEIGFTVPGDRSSGKINGYHCWAQYYLPGLGWFPIDASEAFKHPEKRDYFYGSHPLDRIHFSTGRDLQLGDGHQDQPLNYFIYPHIEVNGKRWRGKEDRSFTYQNVAPAALSAAVNF